MSTTIRIERREHPFVQIDKGTLADPRLSFRATGLLAYLLAKPDDWRIDIQHLAGVKTEGYKAVAAAMRELRACGYVVRRRVPAANGQFAWEATLYETPELAAQAQVFHISTGTGRPQATISPFLPSGATSGNGESQANAAARTMSPKPPDGFGDAVQIKETDRPPRARAKSDNRPRPQRSSTERPIPGYRHDDNPGHDPDPADCSACGTAAGTRRASKATRRAALEAAGVTPSDWPNGPAEPPPVDPEAERARTKAALQELIDRGGEAP